MIDRRPGNDSRAAVAAILWLLVGSTLYWVGCAPRWHARRFPDGPVVVRVVVAEDDAVEIAPEKGKTLRIRDRSGGEHATEVPARFFLGADGRLEVAGGEPGIAGSLRPGLGVQVESDGWVMVKGVPYPGRMEVGANGSVRVVNVVGLENYLRGVVPHEIGFLERSTLEAVKAQAVVSRTYAVRTLRTKPELEATVMDQVYRGAQGHNRWSDKAIEATKGQLVTVAGSPALTVFHSSCGGYTDAIENVWKGRGARQHLRGTEDLDPRGQPFCSGSKYHHWSERWTPSELEAALRRTLPREPGVGTLPAGSPGVVELIVRERSDAGRVIDATLVAWNREYRLPGERIRWVLRRPAGGILRSALVDRFEGTEGGGLVVEGRGWGHGLGMCQMGALERSRRGEKWREILDHYYRDIEIERIPEGG